jgi:hypothetical protein
MVESTWEEEFRVISGPFSVNDVLRSWQGLPWIQLRYGRPHGGRTLKERFEMGMMTKFLTASALAAAMTAGAAQAATVAGTIGPGNDGLAPLDLPKPLTGVYNDNPTLNIPGRIKVTILGWEAGFRNSFSFGGTTFQADDADNFFDTGVGNNDYLGVGLFTWTVNNLLPGTMNFSFGINSLTQTLFNGSNPDGSGPNTAIPNFFASYIPGFGAGGSSVLLFLDDGGADGDDNHDDLIVRLDYLAPIPVPAAGFLLIGALGGLVALRRRKTA